MTVQTIAAPEGDLLNVLYRISPLKWRRFQQRYPEARVDDSFQVIDRSSYSPYISFRLVEDNDEVMRKLKWAVEDYAGSVSWTLHEHKRYGLPGVNWTIRPSRICEVKELAQALGLTSDEYLAKYEPNFGVIAYVDLDGLTEHIRRVFDV